MLLVFNSLKGQEQTMDSCSIELKALTDSCYNLLEVNVEKSFDLAKKSIELSRTCNKPSYEAFSLKLLASYYMYETKYDSATLYYTQSLKLYKSLNDSGFAADVLGLMAQVSFEQGALEQSLKQVNKALEHVYYQDVSNYDLAYGLVTPTVILSDLDRPEALENLHKIKRLYDNYEYYDDAYDGYFYLLTCIYLAQEYHKRKDWEKLGSYLDTIQAKDSFYLSLYIESQYHFLRAVQFAKEGKPENQINNHLQLALSTYDSASADNLLPFQYAYYYSDIAVESDTAQAIALLVDGLDKVDDYWWSRLHLLEKLIDLLDKTQQLDRAYKYTKELEQLRERIHYRDIDIQAISLKLKKEAFEREQIEKEKELLVDYKIKQEENNHLKNALIVVLAVLVFLAIILIAYILRLNKERKQILHSKDKIISVLGHDLRTPLAQIHGIVNLTKSNLVTKDELTQLFDNMEVELDRAQNKLENILQWSKNQLNNSGAQPKNINLNLAIDEAIGFNEVAVKSKNLDFQIKLEDNLEIYADPDQLQVILRNLLSNAIKFSTNNDTIRIRGFLNPDKKYVNLEIKDNGTGMTGNQLTEMNNPKSVQSSVGTNGEKGTGLGLLLVKNYLKANKGKLVVDSILGKGSVFTILLPKAKGKS